MSVRAAMDRVPVLQVVRAAIAREEGGGSRDQRRESERVQAARHRTRMLLKISESRGSEEAAEIADRVDERDHAGRDARIEVALRNRPEQRRRRLEADRREADRDER